MLRGRSGSGISYATSQPYVACSSESKAGICGHVDTSCKPENVARTVRWWHGITERGLVIRLVDHIACLENLDLLAKWRTCSTFGEPCVALDRYPNATISDYGSIRGKAAMMKEIYNRGPISCGINAARPPWPCGFVRPCPC